MIISLDTETTGKDLYHGSRPFFVTTCDERGVNRYWGPPYWRVDPLTREVHYEKGDLEAIQKVVNEAEVIVVQNGKFDVAALKAATGGWFRWPWEKTWDTLIASHVLCSAPPHDLTSLASQYLGVDIYPLEKELKRVCLAARKLVQQNERDAYGTEARRKKGEVFPASSMSQEELEELYPFCNWRIAREGMKDMPSAKEESWKNDMWLPTEIIRYWEKTKVPWRQTEAVSWENALRNYSNADSAVTLKLKEVMEKELRRRGLEKVFKSKMQVAQITHEMEADGVTGRYSRIRQMTATRTEESERLSRVCVNIAKEYDFELTLPKGGVNNSLREFVFERLRLPVVAVTETGEPSLNKEAMREWELILPKRSFQMRFLESLRKKRQRDTSLTYMRGYERFAVPTGFDPDWFVLHPFLNITGTQTTRYSSSNPNEQNISKKEKPNLRWIFGPEPGWEWYSMDGKNLELRIPFYACGEEELIALFERPNDPPYYGSTHLLNFSVVYPDIWEAALAKVGIEKVGPYCKKEYEATWYQWCKNGDFAIQYGAGEKKADATFQRPGSYRLLKARFTKLEKYTQAQIAFANKHGYVKTIPSKFVDPTTGYPLVCTRGECGKISPTIPFSYHVQGTAGVWTESGMIRCHQQIKEWQRAGFNSKIKMQIHDEVVFALPKAPEPPIEDAKYYKKTGQIRPGSQSNFRYANRLRELMEMGGDDIGVPTPVDVEYHEDNWEEGVVLT